MTRPDGLTALGRRMLAVLQERGDWMTRAELAVAVHSKGTTHQQTYLLQRMAEHGLIEIRPPFRKWQRVIYEYKAKS